MGILLQPPCRAASTMLMSGWFREREERLWRFPTFSHVVIPDCPRKPIVDVIYPRAPALAPPRSREEPPALYRLAARRARHAAPAQPPRRAAPAPRRGLLARGRACSRRGDGPRPRLARGPRRRVAARPAPGVAAGPSPPSRRRARARASRRRSAAGSARREDAEHAHPAREQADTHRAEIVAIIPAASASAGQQVEVAAISFAVPFVSASSTAWVVKSWPITKLCVWSALTPGGRC